MNSSFTEFEKNKKRKNRMDDSNKARSKRHHIRDKKQKEHEQMYHGNFE